MDKLLLKDKLQGGPSLPVKIRSTFCKDERKCIVLYGERKSLAWPAVFVLCRCLSHAAEGNNTGVCSIFLYELMEDKNSTPVP